MNTRQTFAMVVGAMVTIACSQCTSSNNDTNQNSASAPAMSGDGSADSESLETTADADAAPPTAEWLPVPGLEMCDGKSLNLSVATWPTRTWTSCGPGCLTAPGVHLPDAFAAGTDHSGAGSIHGETYLRTAMYTTTYNYQELRRMSDDAVLFVLRFRTGCYLASGQANAPFLFEAFEGGGPEDGTIEHWVATFNPDTMKLDVHPSIVTTSPYIAQWLVWNGGWGVIHGGNVDVSLDPNQPELTTVYQKGAQDYGHGQGELIAWVDGSAWPTPIRSFSVKGEQKILIPGNDWKVFGMGIGDTHIAWVAGNGPQAGISIYETAALYWSPLTTDPNAIVITKGPSVTGKMTGRADVGTAGDHVVVTTGGDAVTGAGPGTYVSRISTGQFWFIPTPADTFVRLGAVAEKEVIVKVMKKKTNYTFFQDYRRYDLSKLDELGQQIAP